MYHRSDRVVSARGRVSARHGSQGKAKPRRRRTESTYSSGSIHHGAVMWVQAPHLRVIDLSVPKFLQSRASHPGTILFVHLEQAQMHARVHASGDEGLDLHPFPGQECSSSPPSSGVMPRAVPKGGSGLILHGLFDPREDVAPGKFTPSQSFVKLSQKKLSCVGPKRRDGAIEGCISARIVFCHDELLRDAKRRG